MIHTTNKGLSAARNMGISQSNGEYITFVDGDDIISINMIEVLLKEIRRHNADIACCDYTMKRDDFLKEERKMETSYGVTCLNTVEALKENLLARRVPNNAWGKLYKKELFDEIKFPEGKLFEDQGTTYRLISKSKRIVCVDLVLYCYIQRPGSIQNSRFTDKCFDEIDLCIECKQFIESNYPELRIEAMNRVLSSCFHILFKYYDCNKRESLRIKELIDYIKTNRWKCIISPKASMKVRLGCMSSLIGFRVAYLLYVLSRARGTRG